MIRVLYAEDDLQVADMVRFAFSLRSDECTLDVVNSGRACLDALEREEYDVVLLDLVMPDSDGLQVLRELTSRRVSVPVVMVSGHGQHELAVRALRAGAVDCIDKNSSEFLRIPEIALRVQARYPRRSVQPGAGAPRAHTVLFIDPLVTERDGFAAFVMSSVPAVRVNAAEPESLEPLLRGEQHYDAVVLGPNLGTDTMLAALRQLRANAESIPAIVISAVADGGTTVAAFKLGAHDFLLRGPDCYSELVFSLNHALKQRDTDLLNEKLTRELETLNQSLAAQVAERTKELEQEIVVRREAERHSEENAARLQALSNRLLRVQEDERQALAQELHDQIGQLLTGLRFQLDSARQKARSDAVENALAITDELLRSVRALTLQLRPRLLDDLGLRPALEWHVNTFGKQTGISVDLELSLPEHRLGPELEIAVFRAVQEALTNVARHSGAKAAAVTVTAGDDTLHVEVSDRGRGFDVNAALARHDSLGLTGLSERVRLAGGRLEMFSKPGQGTRMHAEFPLHSAVHSP
jgi:signal transduction histidine kinase